MPRKENTKAKTWERDRRKRMNTYFKTLADLLPPHQDGRKRNKVDILIHASKYIKDLHSRMDDLFSAHASEAHKEELARLKKLVTQLFSRMQLLSTLLREAGISVPAEPALEKISPLKWSNKINVDDAEKYLGKIEEIKSSENKKEKSAELKVPSKRKSVASSQSSAKKLVENSDNLKDVNSSIENQENQANCANSKEENSETVGNTSETGSKDTECRQIDASSDAAVASSLNGKANNALQKVDSQKKVKKKAKKKDGRKSLTPCINNSVTNLTPNTLILSGGKLMPLVTPMTSNIIVNTQQQPANPIILSNTQQNQMIVMQPLTNRVQNPVVSICNQTLINTVQKVTLNTVPSIRANMVVDSQNWASNVKNIINASKIGGHKSILPKGKEVTKTTMTYKVPIPAVHKEKLEKSKDCVNKKDTEVKPKVNKSQVKTGKTQQQVEGVEEENEKEKSVKDTEDANSQQKGLLKRPSSAEDESIVEPADKKRKTNENTETAAKINSLPVSKADFAVTCKSIESLRHVIEKIGEDTNEAQDKNQKLTQVNEKESSTESNVDCPTSLGATNVNHEDISDSSKSGDSIKPDNAECETKKPQNTSISDTISVVALSEAQSKSDNGVVPVSPETELNISVDSALKKSDSNIGSPTAKSPLAEVEVVVQESVESKKIKEVCNLSTELDNLLQVAPKEPEVVDGTTNAENNKIILNLDTNTTTTLKSESTTVAQTSDTTTQSSSLLPVSVVEDETKLSKTSKDEVSKAPLSYNTDNTFVPISNRTDSLHSDLSNDIFASLQVPSSSHNPESISPTAAFLMAFPLVSSLNGKTEVLDEEMKEDFKYHSQTPPMLLQIGAMEPNSFKIKTSSPPHAIAEKRLKVTCEEKKNPPVSEPVNSDIIVPVECSSSTKALPKVVNNEPLREPYKIVQSVLAPSLEKSTSNSFSHASLYSIANVSCATSINTNTETEENCQRQLTTSLQNTITNTSSENVIASQIGTVSTSNKANQTSCPIQTSSCDTSVRYSTSQDFLSSYSTVVDNNLSGLQQSSNVCNGRTIQEANSAGVHQNVAASVSQTSLASHLTNTTTTTNTSSLPLQSMQIDYTSQMKDKDSHSSRVAYGVHGKDSLNDSNIIPNNRLSYSSHVDRTLPTSSQNMQQDYSIQSKDVSLPILSSQGMQTVYDSQPKDTHALTTQQNNHQSYTVHEKDHIVQNSHSDFPVDQNKNLPRKDSVPYSTGTGNASTSNRNQSYQKDSIPNSSENHYQRSYTKINKDSDSTTSNIVDQEGKLNDVLRSKPQEQDHRRDNNYTSTKKMDIDPFAQTFSYGVKESMSTQAEQNVLNQSTNMFQGKGEDTQNYSYTNKDLKKINTSSSNNMSSKSLIQNTSVSRYSQEPTSFVATSNYEQSTVTDNHAKSTTTVAHTSSNFSILSWTTFSPVGGGNNMVQYEQGPSQADNTDAKTICESYSYVPLHKENQNFSNVLTNDVYSTNSTVTNIDKSRMKSGMEPQKPPFVDPTKVRNIQTNVPPSGKQSRMQSQSQASSGSNDYNKFSAENKNNKSKYGMESEYIQNEYSGMNQQSQQQHGPKNHQPIPTKQDKAVYPMSTYDSQVNFDLPEVSSQMKYSVETYASSNFKYPDKSQQQNQNKYQPLIQGQIPPLQHDTVAYNDGKHGQQQTTTKSKGNQQQHAIRAPVNWMMTPEIKHNTNITDIILPPIGKELEFCQNNLFTQTPSYNQGTPNQFYNNYDVAAHSFPNLPVLQSDPKRTSEVFYSEEQPFPWSPTKTSVHIEQAQTVKGIDQHIVPSSLPTLVGDLDLGTNIPEKQNFLFGQVPSRVPSDQSKDPTKDKEGNVTGRDFHTVLNNQTVQHPGAGSSFLSVSQLVEHEKAEKSHQQHHQQHHHHQHHHHHAHQHQQQQQQQQQQQARKHQRKSNTSPRGNSKRQMDIRKQTSGSDQLHQRHEEQKSSGHNFSDQSYQQQQQQQQQQQKYQQNNVHWRSRNCKSNYTAEALIGTNNSVHDTNQDKHASIKFTTNYPQNKFQASLPTADSVMPINYFSNADDGSGYGQMVNQNFNSYTYSSNTNIYPTSNFITSISNTPTNYMMPLHDNTDYMEANAFLLPNVAASSTATSSSTSTVTTSTSNINSNTKNHQHYGKHQNCDKRTYSTNAKKGKRKGLDGTMQNLEFPLSGINSPLEDYHHSTFLPPPPPPHASPLYQNHPQANVYTKAVNSLPPPPSVAGPQGVPSVATAGFPMNPNMPRGGIVSSNPMTMSHHPSGTSLTNFNLSTIFPEMNDKVTGYKSSNGIPSGLSQPPNQSTAYVQRTNYPTNPLCHLPQVSEGSQFGNSVPPPPPPPPPGVIHYKNV